MINQSIFGLEAGMPARDETRHCVVGIGGGGVSTVDRMVREGPQNFRFIAIDADAQALQNSLAHHRIQSGRRQTAGSGERPDAGLKATHESAYEITQLLTGMGLCIITAGMGGATATGEAPVVAQIAKRAGALVVGIVTKPLESEGVLRMALALQGIEELKPHVDALIVTTNERLLSQAELDGPLTEAFRRANGALYEATRGLTGLLNGKGFINLDLGDLSATMKNAGTAFMGTGTAPGGEDRAERATVVAINSPFMDGMSVRGARNILVNVTAGKNLAMWEATAATRLIQREAGGDVEVTFGVSLDESLEEECRVTVVATGYASDGGGNADGATQENPMGPTGLVGETDISNEGMHQVSLSDLKAYLRRN